MEHYAGIDVSLESASLCVVNATGRIVREAKVASEPEVLIGWFGALGFAVARIGLETLLQHPRLQPFLDEADDPPVADAVLQELDQPGMADRVEERPDIGIENPADAASLDPNRERIQRVVLAAPRSKPIAEAQELRLVDRRQNHDHRRLDNFVLDRGDAERPLPAIRLRNLGPTRRQRSIRSGVDTPMEIGKIRFPIFFVHVPRHRIDARRRPPFQGEERGSKRVNGDMVQERRQLLLPVPGDRFPYTGLRLCHGCPALRPDRALQLRIPHGPAPSLHRLRRGSPRFVRRLHWYYGRV
jgi:hypothetical protein